MRPLPKHAIYKMAEQTNLSEVVDKEALYDACAGHPLLARYFIEALAQVTTREDARLVLSKDEGLGRDIEDIYERVWNSLRDNPNTHQVLALLARVDNTISPLELALVVEGNAVSDVRQTAGFLLAGCDSGNWSIFHNSFRVFVRKRTQEKFGVIDNSIEADLNTKLAEIAKSAERNSGQRWLELRYRARAGDKNLVRDLATSSRFRKELTEFRPERDIYNDLRLAYGSLRNESDLRKLMHLMLAEKEISYRVDSMSETDFVLVFLRMGNIEHTYQLAIAATDYGKGAAELADTLYKNGDHLRARQLFEAHEPVDQFFPNRRDLHGSDFSTLSDWIGRAHRFRSIDNIIRIVDALSFDEHFVSSGKEGLMYYLARGIIEDNPSADVKKLCQRLGLDSKDENHLLAEAANYALLVGDTSRCESILEELSLIPDQLETPWARLSARLAIENGKTDEALAFSRKLSIRPSKSFHDYGFRDKVGHFLETVFSTARIFRILGQPIQRDSAENDPFQDKLISHVIALGELQAEIERAPTKQQLPSTNALMDACLFWAHGEPEDNLSLWKSYATAGTEWLARKVVRIADQLGSGALRSLNEQIDSIISRGNNRLARAEKFRLHFAVNMFQCDSDIRKAIDRIRAAENLIGGEWTPHEAVASRARIAESFAAIGEFDQARIALKAIHKDTFGYFLAAKKEPQYEFWRFSLERACKEAPSNTAEFCQNFGRFLIGLSDSEGYDTGQRVAYRFLVEASADPSMCAGILVSILDANLAGWADIVASALEGTAKKRPELSSLCFKVFGRLAVPFNHYRALSFLPAIYCQLDTSEKLEIENDFIDCVSMFANTSSKISFLSQLEEVSDSGNPRISKELQAAKQNFDELRNREKSYSSSVSNGVSIDEYVDVSSLAELLAKSDGASEYGTGVDYSYARRACQLVETENADQLLNFFKERSRFVNEAKFLIAAARRLYALGDSKQGKRFFELAERASRDGSWAGYLGGERLEFQRLRVDLFHDEGKRQGFLSLIADLANGRTSAGTILHHMDEIVDLTVTAACWSDLWIETQEHISQYREYESSDPIIPAPEIKTHEQLIGELFRLGLRLMCPALTDRIRESIHHIAVVLDEKDCFAQICAVLQGDENCHRELSALLWKLSDHSDIQDELVKYARKLADSEDFVVSHLALRILSKANSKPSMEAKELPKFYELAELGDANAERFEEPLGLDPGSTNFWIDDPWFWTISIKFPIKRISEASGLSIEVIRRRCAHFMNKSGGREKFGPEAEKALLARLRSLDLKLNYLRSMPMEAAIAIGKTLNELVQAAHIDLRVLQVIWDTIGGPHLRNFNLSLERRPYAVQLPSVPAHEHFNLKDNDWLHEGGANSHIPIFDGWFVLAEYSEFNMDDRRNRYRTTRLVLPREILQENSDFSLYELPNLMSLDDISMDLGKSPEHPIRTVSSWLFGDLRNATLTLSPASLAELKWRRSPTKPFDIENASGETVARTLRWIDGVGYRETDDHELSGRGQLLMISDKYRGAFETHFKHTNLATLVIQTTMNSEQELTRAFIDGAIC